MWKRFFSGFGTPGLLLGVAATLASLYAADQFLARLERREIESQARGLYGEGRRSLQAGDAKTAIDAFRQAHTLDRDNRAYQVGLAEALIANRQPGKAVMTLQEVLDLDSNFGPANLLMARATIAQQKFSIADSYYHRAIYGKWPAGQEDQPVQARLELVRWLAARGEQNELLSELLPLEQTASADPLIDRELPALYLKAGALTRAEEAYRALMHAQPNDWEPYSGLGEVELEKGDFHAARRAFEQALHRGGATEDLRGKAELAHTAAELDPTPRALTSSEKLARSNTILGLVADEVQACKVPGSLQFDAEAQVADARQLMEGKTKTATNEMAEVRLSLAEKLWRALPSGCHAPEERMKLASVLLRKLAQ